MSSETIVLPDVQARAVKLFVRRFWAWARCWLFYLLLASPAIFLPQRLFTGPRGTWFKLGWPVEIFEVKCTVDGLFSPVNAMLIRLSLVALAVIAASWAWKARLWAASRRNWLGVLIQSWLAGFYCILLTCFMVGWAALIWEWRLSLMDAPALESAMRFGMNWLPAGYALLALGALCFIFVDYRRYRGPAKVFCLVPVACLLLSLRLLAYVCVYQLDSMDHAAAYFHAQQVVNKSSGVTNR